ncbi:OmpA family protein [Flavobacterium sp. 17A]|uniref:OmpA family protein n=1 Tax=Flavobacterium potami TaxID=2872310 RepID=A0A9X1H8V6_9FLAO|nr:OmpA family protein [Flavobacterium potami]MBZ4034257.1 OmpA family protein [Flavobacterium potami]
MKFKNLIINLVFSLSFFYGTAQNAALKKAKKDYDKYAFVDAISIYEKVAERRYGDEKMFQKLGNAYYFNAEHTKAVKWYAALFALNDQQKSEYCYRYSQALKSIGEYKKADEVLEKLNEKVESDTRGELFANNKNYLEQIKFNSGRFEIADAGINSVHSDYGSTILKNKLVFASARDTGLVTKKLFKWTNKSFTNLYAAEINSDGSLKAPRRFDNKINTKFNESTPTFTKDGKTMYFTRNNFLKGKKGKNEEKITLLKIYKAEYVVDKWTNIVELPFNSNQYSTAHPALSTDEKKLYFASDMPGGSGQSDLYSVTINDDGTFGKPENLGPGINTEERETFPFISGDNELYFASDGRPGLGGLDIFCSKILKDGDFGLVQNVGEPVNTKFDDFAFVIDHLTRIGFYSSNKEGGIGNDDIYKFLETRKLNCHKTLSGIITDSESGEGLMGVTVVLLDEKFEKLEEITTSKEGIYSFEIKCNTKYYIRALKEDYETTESEVEIDPSTDQSELNLKLEKRIRPIAVGTDLAKTLKIPFIYFDLDKAIIKKEAVFELEKILAVLEQYPDMKIDVRSHTDSRQSKNYNMVLSDKRAKATLDWFVKRGIAPSRLTGKGYGESQLVNECSDGVKCSEEEHRLNRRSEFVIVSF